ncbi:MAG: hypothetical protein MK098_00080 [Marinovum sp.]|nr:hypothetical protein [Marinovum sp.]
MSDVWQVGRLADASKILECAVILDMIEVPQEGPDFPEDVEVDFPTAAAAMRDFVRLFHGESFTERKTAEHSAKWDRNVRVGMDDTRDLNTFLDQCRVFGVIRGLPM